MLDSTHLQAPLEIDDQTLDPFYYYEILKNRIFYGLIPFVGVLAIGFAVAMLWPPTFLSVGKILVQSQQIPVDLVRPTVTATASERLATIEQRVMTRDNLLKIVDKYQLFANQRDTLSRTDLLDLMRSNTVIKPVVLDLQSRQNENFTVAITIGFTDRRPDIATKVANELITLFLNEDSRNRTSRATETTKFLEQEVQKLQADLASIDAKILESRRQAPETTLPQLTALKAELALKEAVYSPSHPEVRRLKATIAALEKVTVPVGRSAAVTPGANDLLDPLWLQRMGIQQNLESTAQKLAAARRGENLERDQFAERLEVLEQAVPPQTPIKPSRPKIIALAFLAAVMAGFAGIMAVESFDKTIRGNRDLLSVANGQLIVAIPYIVTQGELLHKKRRIVIVISLSIAVVLTGLVAMHFLVRPLDELWVILMQRLGI
jgi:capsular polysaccharide biosynthesis protein